MVIGQLLWNDSKMNKYQIILSFTDKEQVSSFIENYTRTLKENQENLRLNSFSLRSTFKLYLNDPMKYAPSIKENMKQMQKTMESIHQNLKNLEDLANSFMELSSDENNDVTSQI